MMDRTQAAQRNGFPGYLWLKWRIVAAAHPMALTANNPKKVRRRLSFPKISIMAPPESSPDVCDRRRNGEAVQDFSPLNCRPLIKPLSSRDVLLSVARSSSSFPHFCALRLSWNTATRSITFVEGFFPLAILRSFEIIESRRNHEDRRAAGSAH
jgi:hypothetical protein